MLIHVAGANDRQKSAVRCDEVRAMHARSRCVSAIASIPALV